MSSSQAFGVTVLRVTLGVIFVMHAYLGVALIGPTGLAGFVAGIGYPAAVASVLAWYLILAHGAGGLLLVLGLWTRWAALAQVPIMASATLLVHGHQGFFMKAVEAGGRSMAGGYEFALLVLAGSVALVFLGGGALAVDRRR